jgi:hypothetical protein
MPIMGMDRSTDDPIDTVGCWRFDRKLTTPRLDECGELIRNRSNGRYLISQPRLEQLGIGDGRLPEAKQGSNLGAMAFPGPACRVVPGVIIELRAKLSSYLLDNPLIDVCRLLGEPSVCPVKQEQHSEPKTVRTILRYNERLICRGQHQRFGSIAVIGHSLDSMTGFVAKLLSSATASRWAESLAF